MTLLDQIMSNGPSQALIPQLTLALAEWSAEDQKLRAMLVAEVQAGRVRVPHGIVRHQDVSAARKRRLAKKSGHPVCAECRFTVPRLAYPEWKFASTGQASFRDLEIHPPVPASV